LNGAPSFSMNDNIFWILELKIKPSEEAKAAMNAAGADFIMPEYGLAR